jgi:threonine synthase
VNSINWSRVLAQIVYYFYAAFRVMERTGAARVRFSVPTGNFGDIFAGYLAARMGLPISRLILATNENDILARFFNSGDYRIGSVRETLSPSMDIQVASNFERYLYYRLGEDSEALGRVMQSFGKDGRLPEDPRWAIPDPLIKAGTADTPATLSTIREFYTRHRYLLDPHTAAGVCVGQRYLDDEEPMICLATAHPAKFAGAIQKAVGSDVAQHPVLERLRGMPTRRTVLPASVEAVKAYVERQVSLSGELS